MKKFTSFLAALSIAATSVSAADYVEVTDLAEITSGKYVITAEEGWDVALTSEVYSTTYFYAGDVTISNGIISSPTNDMVWDIVVTDGVLTIQSLDTEMFAAYTVTSGNSAQASSDGTADAAKWTIDWNKASDATGMRLQNVNIAGRYLQYNTSSPRFACYTGSQKDLRFFKEVDATEATISAQSTFEMGSVACGSTVTSSLAIEGALLTSDVTVSLAGDDAFAAETATYSADEVMAGVDFAITFTAPETAGDYTATVTISSSECETIEVAVSATAVEPIAIADIFSMDDNETAIIATATVDYVYTYGAYISDAAGTSILALYLTDVEAGDVLSNISATVGTYNGVKQIKSVSYGALEAGESTIEAIEVTLADLMSADLNTYGCQLVTVKGVTLAATGFTSNKITITQGETSSTLYNGFYITNDDFPTYADVTGYVSAYSNAAQINPRWQDDVVAASSSAIVMTEASTTAVAGATGAIVVKAAAATTATIYNTIGQVVAIVEVAAGESAVTLAQGLYLVSVDGTVTKAVVR